MELFRWWYMSLSPLPAVSRRARWEGRRDWVPSRPVLELELVVDTPPRLECLGGHVSVVGTVVTR
jgi:hypothetical protein